MFIQQLINGLTLGSAYAVIAIGYTLIQGVLGIVNMAHGSMFMAGAYIGLVLVTQFNANIFVAMIGAMVGGAILGFLMEILALRPLRRNTKNELAPLISTIGVSIFMQSIILLIFGPQTRSFPNNFSGKIIRFPFFEISLIQIISLGTAVFLMVALNLLINKTKVGKAIRATSENPEAASILGIDTNRVIVYTFMLATSMGAAAGVLIGLTYDAIEPMMGVSMGFKGLAVLVLGGLGNIKGAMVGGFLLGVAEILTVAYGASAYRDAVAFGMIIIILFWRPQGLFGSIKQGGRP
ncbi:MULTISPECIES: branched-chain amino acid ABC transporter permease [unclassified Jeotgalibaca]|uniref:branched-chain amino acid ABC transporter permease n=1 Tax=unclassified Jeotgalibaca TaxID=2621505 RepID=UPI003FD03A9D